MGQARQKRERGEMIDVGAPAGPGAPRRPVPPPPLDHQARAVLDEFELARSASLLPALAAVENLERIAQALRFDAIERAHRTMSWAQIGQELGITKSGAAEMSKRAKRRSSTGISRPST